MKNREQRLATLSAEELPPGWIPATIGEMIGADGVFTDGDWVVSKDQDPNGDVRLVQLADIGDGFWVNKSNRYLTYEKAIELGCTFLEREDVLIARMPDPLGRACTFPGDPKRSITAVDVCIVRTGNQGVSHRWLMHTVNSPAARVAIESLQSGSTRKRISRKNLARIEFPLPPSPEQRRIVAEIETQFTRLDAGVAALERAQANLKRYRASVLKAACEGCLLSEEEVGAIRESPDYEPADQLLARILAERRARWEVQHPGKKYKEPAPPETEDLPELPEGWVWTNLEQLKAFSLYGPRFSSKDYSERGKLVLRTSDISESGKVNLETPPRLPLDPEQFAKYRCQIGDLLITRTGSLGTLAVFNDDVEAIPGAYLIQYRLVAPGVTSWYVFYLFKSPSGQEYLVKGGVGVGRPNLSAPTIEEFAIPLPPLSEQQSIVAEVERRLSVVAALEREVEAALARAARLRQSILTRAFEGRLVAQDPNDEPAAALLERIRVQREREGKGTR